MQQRPARPRRPGGQSEWELGARGTPASRQIAAWLRKPQFYLPGLVVLGMTLVAFGLQPGTGQSMPEEQPNVVAMAPSTHLPSPTTARSSTATAEVVVASGQGRNVTLVVMVKNGVGATTGPMTLTIDAPLFGGKETPGTSQLFLPTP